MGQVLRAWISPHLSTILRIGSGAAIGPLRLLAVHKLDTHRSSWVSQTQYSVVFDIAQRELAWWPAVLALVLLALGFVAFFWRDRFGRVGENLRSLIVAGLLVGAWFGFHFVQLNRLQSASESGAYRTAEGRVEGFAVPPAGNHGPEVFRVNGQRFEVEHPMTSEAFNQTVYDGGPDLTGRCVLIHYTKPNEIIWLGVGTEC